MSFLAFVLSAGNYFGKLSGPQGTFIPQPFATLRLPLRAFHFLRPLGVLRARIGGCLRMASHLLIMLILGGAGSRFAGENRKKGRLIRPAVGESYLGNAGT